MANPAITADGSLLMAGDSVSLQMTSPDRFTGDFVFEFSVFGNIAEAIGAYAVEGALLPLASAKPAFGFWRSPADSNTNLFAVSSNAAGSAFSSAFSAANGDRLSILRTGDVVRFYKNYSDANTEPLWVSPHVPSGVFKIGIAYNGFSAELFNVIKARLRLNQLGFLYTAATQVADFGSTQSSVKVRVAQESALVGRGPYTESLV